MSPEAEAGAVRPTIIKVGERWQSKKPRGFFVDESVDTTTLDTDAQKKERRTAFDILDALTKSGGLPLEACELHVVVAATHCFGKTLVDTVVQDNQNPIQHVERSSAVMAAAVHAKPAKEILNGVSAERICLE